MSLGSRLGRLERCAWGVGVGFFLLATGSSNTARAEAGGAEPFTLSADPLKIADHPAPSAAAKAPAGNRSWQVVARLGLWGMGVDGDASVGNHNAEINMDFSDILDNLNFALMPTVEVGYEKWVVVFNGVFAKLESDEDFSRTLRDGRVIEGSADVEMDLYIADVAMGYRMFDIPLGRNGGREMNLSLTPAVGLRYTYLEFTLDPDRFESRSRDENLWDPYVGGRVNLQISPHVAWRTDGSVGGFGVGSDFIWTAQSFIDWRFHGGWELNLGYRAMYYDVEDGDFEFDLTMHGPWVGLSYWF